MVILGSMALAGLSRGTRLDQSKMLRKFPVFTRTPLAKVVYLHEVRDGSHGVWIR